MQYRSGLLSYPIIPITGFFITLCFAASGWADTVFVDNGGNCNGNTPCFSTIQDGVNAATAPADVRIFPGTYNESVNIGLLNSDLGNVLGNLAFQALNAGGGPAVGTVTVIGGLDDALMSGGVFTGDLDILGINFESPAGDGIDVLTTADVILNDIVAGSTNGEGININLTNGGDIMVADVVTNANAASGINILVDPTSDNQEITISIVGVEANSNGQSGIEIISDTSNDGRIINLILLDITANQNNGSDGVVANAFNGTVTARNITAIGNNQDGLDIEDGTVVSVRNIRTQNNGGDGVELDASISLSAFMVTSQNNAESGFEVDSASTDDNDTRLLGDVDLTFIQVSGNNFGIEFDDVTSASSIRVSNSNIIGNTLAGLNLDTGDDDAAVDARGNYWGSASGPVHPLNPGGTGDAVADGVNVIEDSIGTVSFLPFLQSRALLTRPVPVLGISAMLALALILGWLGLARINILKK